MRIWTAFVRPGNNAEVLPLRSVVLYLRGLNPEVNYCFTPQITITVVVGARGNTKTSNIRFERSM